MERQDTSGILLTVSFLHTASKVDLGLEVVFWIRQGMRFRSPWFWFSYVVCCTLRVEREDEAEALVALGCVFVLLHLTGSLAKRMLWGRWCVGGTLSFSFE